MVLEDFWIEGLRTDSLYLGPLRISQVVALRSVFLGLAGIAAGRFLKTQEYQNQRWKTERD